MEMRVIVQGVMIERQEGQFLDGSPTETLVFGQVAPTRSNVRIGRHRTVSTVTHGGSLSVFAATKVEQCLTDSRRELDASELLIAVLIYKLRLVLFAGLVAEGLLVGIATGAIFVFDARLDFVLQIVRSIDGYFRNVLWK